MKAKKKTATGKKGKGVKGGTKSKPGMVSTSSRTTIK